MGNEIIELYKTHKSVWKVGAIIGRTGQWVHTYLNKNGVNTSKPKEFTEDAKQELIDIYKTLKHGDGQIDAFCEKYNKSKANVCRTAKRLGLTSKKLEFDSNYRNTISIYRKKWFETNEHPRGFLNHTHTNEVRAILSLRSKKMWKDPNCSLNSEEYRQNLSDRMSKLRAEKPQSNPYSRAKIGRYDINGVSYFFRSSWEANYALYLDFLIKNKSIEKWEYEKDVFWFEAIKRGVRSYKPDFKVYENNGKIVYHEVKGYYDDKSKTKIKRMAKYHPEINLILILEKQYKEIIKKLGGVIKFY